MNRCIYIYNTKFAKKFYDIDQEKRKYDCKILKKILSLFPYF